ncbi:MAG: hypothetical protein KGJ94_10560 [Xanthomonadaceae bacterium]|nr:hypothetical protein [Xanthomonadaceae bacterium]
MELDEMKRTWAAMELRLDGMESLLRSESRERRTGRARAALRPLFWGQSLQLAVGNLLVACGAVLWATHLHQSGVLACGLVANAYGLLLTIFSARNLYLIHHIDYAAPVLDIQRRMAELCAFRVRVETPINAVAGCFIWIPVLWANLALYGLDLWSPGLIHWALASGAVGLIALAAVVWVMRRLGYGHKVDEASAGRSIVRAQAALDEVARFERG